MIRLGVPVLALCCAAGLACGTPRQLDASPPRVPTSPSSPVALSKADASSEAAWKRLDSTLQDRCVVCHDETHRLDLRKTPAANNGERWSQIYEAVSSMRMPPPSESTPFPMDPAVRRAMTHDIQVVRGPYAVAHPAPVVLDAEVWLTKVRGLVAPYISTSAFNEIVHAYRGELGGVHASDQGGNTIGDHDERFAFEQLSMTLIARDLCALVIQTEGKASSSTRRLPVSVKLPHDSDESSRSRLATGLYDFVFHRKPSAAELIDAVSLLEGVSRKDASLEAPAVALCSAYFSGARIWTLPFTPRGK